MILVIADDLSGAAELAGVAAWRGLKAEVHTTLGLNSGADVIAVDTDTRALPAAEAARMVADITRAALEMKPAWIYKKTDSVLRGNIVAEIGAILAVTGHARALFIPANPSRQRLIRDGIYYVAGVPLAETTFAHDHEHPRRSSRVNELLAQSSPDFNLVVPDVTCAADITTHAGAVDTATLSAGAADFFAALLEMKFKPGVRDAAESSGTKTLFVCGSAAAWDGGRAEECAAHGIPVFAMPEEIFQGETNAAAMNGWLSAVAGALREHGRAMLAIGRPSTHPGRLPPRELTTRLVDAAADILLTQTVDRICLEGGATAAALLRRCGWNRLETLPSDLNGVGMLRPADGPLLLIKPGSYPWPAAIWPQR